MVLGKSVRIYLADGSVSGIRHGEIVNWTGQAIACPRLRFTELKDWTETKRPGVYFLFGQDEETGQDSVYIGEAEVVFDRLCSHINGKDFWNDAVAFTSKDDNLTKAHVRYLESRIVALANRVGRYEIKNSASPQLPSLPRADRDAMEEFITGIKTLLGVLGHRVLEPLIAKSFDPKTIETPIAEIPLINQISTSSLDNSQEFQLQVSNIIASAMTTDEGLVVLANSEASNTVQNSLSIGYRTLRERLISTGILIENGSKLKFSKDQLFRSPSQAAAIIVGYSINGRNHWKTSNGISFSDFESKITKS